MSRRSETSRRTDPEIERQHGPVEPSLAKATATAPYFRWRRVTRPHLTFAGESHPRPTLRSLAIRWRFAGDGNRDSTITFAGESALAPTLPSPAKVIATPPVAGESEPRRDGSFARQGDRDSTVTSLATWPGGSVRVWRPSGRSGGFVSRGVRGGRGGAGTCARACVGGPCGVRFRRRCRSSHRRAA